MILFRDVVSFQYSWEAAEKGKKLLSNVQCLEQVSRTRDMFIVSSFHVLHSHGNVMDSRCGSIFPPGKDRLGIFLCFLYIMGCTELSRKFQNLKLTYGS